MKHLLALGNALSDPSRVRMLAAIAGSPSGELCVCEVTDLLDLAPSTVSKHLSILRDAGLITGRKQGRWLYCRAAGESSSREAREALAWVRAAMSSDPQLKEDARALIPILARSAASGCCTADSVPGGTGDRVPRVLFLCTGNSCRSQMAEGWARALKSGVIDAYSAGTSPHGLNPLAVRAMAEAGVDISGHSSKRPEDIGVQFDHVVTVCDSAHESCPHFPATTRIVHAGFEDPPRLAAGANSDDEALPHYRRVRDEIRRFIESLPGALVGPVDAQTHAH